MADESNNLTALLLSAEDTAKVLGIGKTLFYSLHSSGQFGPVPINLGRRTLWRRREIEDWVTAGCPPRQQWLQKEGRPCHANV